MSKFLENKYIINLHDDSKIPITKNWSSPPYNTEIKNKNYSVLTGSINNLLVVDIDLLENKTAINHYWKELIGCHGKPKTLTVRTPSGGYHYYFKFDPEIKTTISLKVNGEATSIDIINESRDKKPLNVVGIGSTINNTPYKIIKDDKIRTMPQWLKTYITSNQKANSEAKINKIYESKNQINALNKIFTVKDSKY